MQRHLKAAVSLICGLTVGSTAAWGAEPTPAPPPLNSGDANAFSLELAGGTALAGLGLAAIVEMNRAGTAKEPFIPGRAFVGLAAGGAAGGAASGLGLALFVDNQPSWLAAAVSSILGLAVGAGGTIGVFMLGQVMEREDKIQGAEEMVFALSSLALPVVTALVGSLTYQGVRQLTTPQPSPTPIPLQTPWPTPSPPVRLFL